MIGLIRLGFSGMEAVVDTVESIPEGALEARLAVREQAALASGALEPWVTDAWEHEEDGVRFQLRALATLSRKPKATGPGTSTRKDPFAPPYERDLVVGGLGPSHVVMLNKFPVVGHHGLVVTTAYEPQDAPLTPLDFAAVVRVLRELDALVFYNSGATAGASQGHKHLQFVPGPLAREGRVPLETRLLSGELPFVCAAAAPMPKTPGELLSLFKVCQARAGVKEGTAWNLLATRAWLAVIPRSQESTAGVSLNALAYAGLFFSKARADVEALAAHGCLKALVEAGVPRR